MINLKQLSTPQLIEELNKEYFTNNNPTKYGSYSEEIFYDRREIRLNIISELTKRVPNSILHCVSLEYKLRANGFFNTNGICLN